VAKVEILKDLKEEILKKFKAESKIIFKLMCSLKENPHKGKELGNIGSVVIKEVRHKSFRFYFITDGQKLRIMDINYLSDLLIRFVRMSDKNEQQKVINEIRIVLQKIGEGGF